MEAFTYRHYGHVDWRKDIDVGVERTEKNIKNWERRDPIKRLSEGMIEGQVIDINDLEEIYQSLRNDINESWEKALKDPYPTEKDMLERVYKND